MGNALKEAALKYAEMGLAVFPVKPPRLGGTTPGKRPYINEWQHNASTDKAQVEQWWTKWSDANIGIATGRISGGLVVIDLDIDEDKDISGYEILKKWQQEHGNLPETWQSITGRGGYHLFYKDFAVNHNKTGLYEGVDIRGDGGYVVAPPSLHKSGRCYEWEQDPGEYPLAGVNSKVLDFITPPLSATWDKKGFEMPEVVPDGQRTDYMVKMVCSLQAKGVSDVAIRAAVQAENDQKCKPPLTETELEKEVFPALKRYEKGTAPYLKGDTSADGIYLNDSFAGFAGFAGIDTTKLSLFDIALLPSVVRGFSEALIESLQVSPGMVAPAIITVGALGIQKKYSVHPLVDWYETGNLYTAIVAEPSERKSPVMKEIMKPLYDYEKKENDRLAPDVAMYETQKKILEGKMTNITKSASRLGKKKEDDKYLDMGDLVSLQQELNELQEITPIRLVVDDVTMEVLGKLMEQNHERIGIMSTEGGIFNIFAGRYSDKTVIDLVLKGYSGDRFSQDRMGRKGQTLEHPLITMLLYVQPKVIQEIMDNSEFVGRGLNARFLYSIPPSTIGERRYKVKKISDFDRADYSDVIQRLFAIPIPEIPKRIELDETADKIAEEFFYEIEKMMKEASSEFKAWLGKLHGTTMRIALVLHCFQYIATSEHHKIDGEVMKNAIEIGRYFKDHAEVAFNIMGLSDPAEVKDAKYILKRIDACGLKEMKLRDLHDSCRDRKGMEKKEGMVTGLNCLIDHGYIRIQKSFFIPQNPQNPQKGGRPSEIVYVNPEYIKWRAQEKESNQ